MARKFKTGDKVKIIDPMCTDESYKFLGYTENDMIRLECRYGRDDLILFENEVELVLDDYKKRCPVCSAEELYHFTLECLITPAPASCLCRSCDYLWQQTINSYEPDRINEYKKQLYKKYANLKKIIKRIKKAG